MKTEPDCGGTAKAAQAASLSNVDVVVYALYRLGGATRKVHTEEITWESYQLAPGRFSWRLPQFRDRGFPDKDIARVTLVDAERTKHGRLVTGRCGVTVGGRGTDGWRLTPAGVKWVLENRDRISTALGKPAPTVRPKDAQHILRQLKRDPAFLAYAHAGIDAVTRYMFTDLLGCSPDAPASIFSRSYQRTRAAVELTRDQELLDFFERCEKRFGRELGITDPDGGQHEGRQSRERHY